ncbi:SDR family NAD(P)-dependent oxidoreductase, partial [Aquimarina sp. RZ0]|uniref:SDR family NAD(P)-dependent oxidoreductase n=1 Tax=Aquimarina sp. RZ0 TaxID=2607730 RepID=UPI0011F0FBF9
MTNNNSLKRPFTSLSFYKNLSKKSTDKKLFTFKDDNDNVTYLTGEMLVKKVMLMNSTLQNLLDPQDKAIIVLPQGLEYISSLLACLYANVIAIPTSVVSIEGGSDIAGKILPILKDADAKCIITDTSFRKLLEKNKALASVSILCVDEFETAIVALEKPRKSDPEDTALLLYTSGSTAKPKGVMLTHNNVWNQAKKGADQWGIQKESCIVSWMPQFHSFGLFFNVMSPLLRGTSSIILPPDSFVKNPYKWFEIISRYQATHIAAPNFAFDYCCASLDLIELEKISLNSLKAIICGGEPIRKETYENFIEKFKVLGLKSNIFCPHYGMSEAGSVVTKSADEEIGFLSLDIPNLEKGVIKIADHSSTSKSVLSCGKISEDDQILFVNPKTGSNCQPDEVGEIWIKCESVAKGYLNQHKETEKTFNGILKDSGETGFFRTGDLGFIKEKHLYIIGREKEVIIVNGKNYHPVDIEWVIKNKFPDLTLPICVFSCELDQQEKIIVVLETEVFSDSQYKNLSLEILNCVAEIYMLEIYEVNLVKKGTIPKTGSGKIQRKNSKKLYTQNKLSLLYNYKTGSGQEEEAMPVTFSNDFESNILKKLRNDIFSSVLGIEPKKLKNDVSFGELGFDSIKYIRVSKKIEEVFKIQFAPVMLFKHRTIDKLSQYLCTQIDRPKITDNQSGESKNAILKVKVEQEDTNIAVIGISCNFPGAATSPEAFWENIINKKDCISTIAQSRPQIIKDYQSLYGKSADFAPKWGGFIEDVDTFDAGFFGISPLEAESMDPQQRKILELTWKVIEDGGYDPKSLTDNDIGLFIGVHANDYAELISKRPSLIESYGAYTDSGLHMSMIPHRVSRWFNFHGPSEIINTACSSSLVAIHHAIESINKGECTMAIAGGINMIFSSRIYMASYKAGMLSKDGHCKTFDDSADGFVRSEGYGAVLLKPYKEALKDNDTIYGIIRGTAINHDGQSTSLRAPNLNAQKQLIKSAYDRAGIPAETISYLEAHGTGTSLGDPIEIQALKEAFEETGANSSTSFCGIGAVKTVIGHSESAAGIAGLIKVLLSMRAKTLPGILHFDKLNKYISLEETPFYVIDKTKEWKRLKDAKKQETPRRAGISSFGFGGGNAHVIVEEHITVKEQRSTNAGKVIIPFSAKNIERLRTSIEEFIEYLQKTSDKNLDLLNLSYTLQVGRNDMEERFVCLVQSIDELKEKLNLFIEGEKHIEDCWYGNTYRSKDIASQLGSDKDSQELIDKWFSKNKLSQIAQSWVQGATIEWHLLYKENKPYRVSLPTYPFAKTRYWIPDEDPVTAYSFNSETMGVIHPLLQQNTSDFTEQRFSTTFTGKEFFLSDHIVNGQQVLPGVIYLEMARASLENSYRLLEKANNGIKISNISWNHPVIVDKEPVQIHIALYIESNKRTDYEIYTENPEDHSETILHSQGSLIVENVDPILLDLNSIKTKCSITKIMAEEFYENFRKKGIDYGSSFTRVKEIYLGAGIALAELNVPTSEEGVLNQFVLHPGLLDAAFHASSVFMNDDEQYLALPYKIEEVEIHANCSSRMWAKIEHINHNSEQEEVNKFTIMLCDDDGNVCVNIKELSVVRVENNFGKNKSETEVNTLLFSPEWKEQPFSEKDNKVALDKRLLILIEPETSLLKQVSNELESEDIQSIVFNTEGQEIEERYTNYALKLFKELQSVINNNSNEKTCVQVIASVQKEQKTFRGLVGMLKTAFLEYPNCIVQFISIDSWKVVTTVLLDDNSNRPWETFIQYRGNKRYTFDWNVIQNSSYNKELWKTDGVYIITGGMGGLGILFAQEVIDNAENPIVILTGRSVLNTERKKKIQQLEREGATVEYKQTDITQMQEVYTLVQDVVERFGALNGIIHSAGIIQDNYIIKKTEAELKQVLGVKVQGSINLDKASEMIPLDFFIMFSSIAGSLGNAGQADYAAANSFMDNFAVYRNDLVTSQKRFGHTLSVNWPLWKGGGMQVGSDVEGLMKQNMGMLPMITSHGMASFYQAFTSGKSQIMVIEGYEEKIHSFIKEQTFNVALQKSLNKNMVMGSPGISPELLEEKAIQYFKKLLSSVIRLPVNEIDADSHMDKYGIDSIMIMQLTTRLEKVFGILPKTLFFEYKSIKTLTGYFLEDFNAELIILLELDKEEIETNTSNTSEAYRKQTKFEPVRSKRSRFTYEKTSKKENPLKKEDIAIIGLAGQYPDSQDIHKFWEVLKNGKDCITEIPKERWDASLYYDEDRNAEGKTYTKWGGFLKGVDQFDPLFFNISPREAEMMDPQERIFLQCVHKAIEDAGYSKESLMNTRTEDAEGKVGVFVGVMFQEYQLYGAQEQTKGNSLAISGNIGSIANRVSYFYNLHGPSMTVDTMCSSSLSAVHLACQSLSNSECEFAIAGGVNVSIHPNKYLLLAQGNFASSKGKCESFGEGGDGYVPGEGVGAVLLKPLSKAIEDGDHIYGIIKSTAINHGGKTNGYTVPNPNAQADVIDEALTNAEINPRTINYIEAHGTGTSLGDPIEIAGLTKVFKKYDVKDQFCAIGSVKSNIGHCESAAGMAGITKILMQMKHKQLVPSLHSKELNPNIDFTNSPFLVQQELTKWERVELIENGKAKEYPRRAGLSSFGAGGSNAHIIIEEYIPTEERNAEVIITKQNPAIILLSAKDDERLKEQVENLLKALKTQKFSDEDLLKIAYTLQVGRSVMEERMAMLVTSLSQLEDNLVTYLENKIHSENVYYGSINSDKSLAGVLGLDNDVKKIIASWIQKKKYEKILDLWVSGIDIDWQLLYEPGHVPSKISLPTYPFAKERYWVPFSESRLPIMRGTDYLHPLIHKNISNLGAQKFSSIFTGAELFLSDHLIKGGKIVPGVVYLELARAAGFLSLETSITQFRDVNWLHPIEVKGVPFELEVGIFKDSEGFGYEVYSGSGDSELIHSQGSMSTSVFLPPSPYDISALRSAFSSEKSGSSWYTIFKDLGIEYGASFQGVEHLYYSPEGCLSKIGLSRDSAYVLQPGVLDSALQSCLGLSLNDSEISLSLPFSIKEVTIYGEVSQASWCYVRKGSAGFSGNILSYDIDLLSASGDVLLRMKDFVTLPLDGFPDQGVAVSTTSGTDAVDTGLHLYGNSWEDQELDSVLDSGVIAHLVILSGGSVSLSDKLRESLECAVFTVDESDELSYYQKIQEILKPFLLTKRDTQVIVLYRNSEYLDYSFITGLLRTAVQENPKLQGKTIGLDSLSIKELDELLSTLHSEFSDVSKEVRYLDTVRQVRRLTPLASLEGSSKDALVKQGGVYLITGGCGGLGRIFASHLSATSGTQLILAGRRKESSLSASELASLRAVYYSCDVSDKDSVFRMISDLKDTYGTLDGIIHSAGVLRDGFLLNKAEEEAFSVLSPKILGTRYLDEASKDLDLDFMLYFSSIAGVIGNIGQSDYSSGNAWMDRYAVYRNDLVSKGKRKGISLSINWPLWSEGGMSIDAELSHQLASRTGLVSLPTREGIIAFDGLLSGGFSQGVVLYGDKTRFEDVLLDKVSATRVVSDKDSAGVTDQLLRATIAYMKSIFSSVLKLPSERIDPEGSFSQYGIDSIMISKLTNRLNEDFEDLPVTLLFEYQTLGSLSAYLAESYTKHLLDLTGLNSDNEAVVPFLEQTAFRADIDAGLSRRKRSTGSLEKGISSIESSVKEDIAIIGISGRYPGAATLEDFWENLKQGKDCITE